MNDDFVPFYPIDFFDFSMAIPYIETSKWKEEIKNKKARLPDLSEWLFEEARLEVYGGWSEAGLFFYIESQDRLSEPHFPDFTRGDSLELFIDTRALKEGRFIHRFCHHFYFLPEAVVGKTHGEVTRFRGEESHPPAKEEDIELHMHYPKGKSAFQIFLSKEALFGYDPAQCSKIGFCCRLNRARQEPLHYHIKSEEFKVEEEPTLWLPLSLRAEA